RDCLTCFPLRPRAPTCVDENPERCPYSLLHRCRKAFEGPESKGPKNPWSKKGVQLVTGMGVAVGGLLYAVARLAAVDCNRRGARLSGSGRTAARALRDARKGGIGWRV